MRDLRENVGGEI